jgi:tetratricopeptide (TPR) repeat protein
LAMDEAAVSSHLHLSGLHMRAGDLHGAAAAVSQALELAPREVAALRRAADVAIRQGDLPQAAALAEAMIGIDPAAPASYCLLSTVHLRDNRLEDAAAAITSAMGAAPRDPTVLRSASDIAMRQGDLPRALSIALEAARIDPVPASYALLSTLHLRLGDLDAAETATAKWSELAPSLPSPIARLGEIAMHRGDLDDAVALTRRAIEATKAAKSADLSAFRQLARLYSNLGEAEAGEAVLQEGLDHRPDMDLMCRMAQSLQRRAQPAEAAAWLQKAIALESTQIRPRLMLADLLLRQGALDEAERELETIRGMGPDSPELQKLLASLTSRRRQAARG